MMLSGRCFGHETAFMHRAQDPVSFLAMRKGIGALVALQLWSVAPVSAQGDVREVFPARPAGHVTDVAGLLDPGVRASLEQRLLQLKDATGAEVAVVTLPTI